MQVDAMDDLYPRRTLTVAEARAALERLRDGTGSVPAQQPAAPGLIDDLHQALIPIASGKMRLLYNLDNVVDVTMGQLHNRVMVVLANFETPLAERTQELVERQPPD